MDQHKLHKAGVQEKLEIVGVEDEAGNPISALTILSLLERVAGIIDNVQASQQRMEERQVELEDSIKSVQGDVLKLAKDHSDTGGTVDKLLQKTRKVSANVKEVRARVEKQNLRVKKVESTQDELLTRNKFRVVIYQVGTVREPSEHLQHTQGGNDADAGTSGRRLRPSTVPASWRTESRSSLKKMKIGAKRSQSREDWEDWEDWVSAGHPASL